MSADPADPVNSTKPEFSRRGFVALSAGAALAAGGAAADAQTELGKPHPPFVAEDDPAIVVSRPRLRPSAGSPIAAYAARPRTVVLRTPGVVVIQHIWGVDATIRDTVRRYAKAGCRITTPLMGSFGARDTSIKPDDVRAMFARLTVPHDLRIYDEAGHAFFDDTRSSYVPSAAADAWTRTLAWFKTYLA